MQHGTFLFTLACNSPPPPPPLHHPTHTHPWPPPFPPLYQLKGIWLLPSDSPRLKVPFTLPQFTKRSDYGKQKYCVRAPFFCAWAKRCERHKNSGGKEREIEREPLIKLHLVKQTSLHSSCQKRRIYVAVNKKQYLRVLTETNVGRGQPYIIHSAPRPRPTFSSQVGFPYVVETAAFLEACCFFRPRWCDFQQRALFLTIYLAGRKINHQWAGRADRSEVSEVSQWLVCVQHDEAAFQSQTPGSSGLSSLSSLSLCYPSKWLIMSVPLVTLFVKRLVPDNSRQLVHEEEMVSKKEQDLLLFQNISLRRLSGS